MPLEGSVRKVGWEERPVFQESKQVEIVGSREKEGGMKRNIRVKKNCFEGRIMSSTELSSWRRNRTKLIYSPWVSGVYLHLL